MAIYESGRPEDLARLTLPLHGPSPTQIDGWHFRNSDNTGPNDAGPKNVNAPQEKREFIFSPQVGRSIDGPTQHTQLTMEDIDRVSSFGRGKLTIVDYRLNNLVPGQPARFAWMKFQVELSWNE